MDNTNLVKPSGFFTYRHAEHSKIVHGARLALCFVRISEVTATFAAHVIRWLVFVTEEDSVYCAVRTECLYNTDTSRPLKGQLAWKSNTNSAT